VLDLRDREPLPTAADVEAAIRSQRQTQHRGAVENSLNAGTVGIRDADGHESTAAAEAFGIDMSILPAHAGLCERTTALAVGADPLFDHRDKLVAMAARHALPTTRFTALRLKSFKKHLERSETLVKKAANVVCRSEVRILSPQPASPVSASRVARVGEPPMFPPSAPCLARGVANLAAGRPAWLCSPRVDCTLI
jgi:hypothetical protein